MTNSNVVFLLQQKQWATMWCCTVENISICSGEVWQKQRSSVMENRASEGVIEQPAVDDPAQTLYRGETGMTAAELEVGLGGSIYQFVCL